MHSGGSLIACTSAAAGRHDKKRQKSSEGQDMISDLPDFVIGRILSFLPTKYAVRTSALSQRWMSKWMFLTDLRKFSYRGNISSDTFVLDAEDIGSANILMFNFEDTNVQETWIFICKLLTVNAKCLNLCLHADWQYLLRTKHYLADIPAFGMLSALELNSVTHEILLGLLLKSPSLETLVFQMLDYDEEAQNFSIVPGCFLSTLKVVKFGKFAGEQCELCFAKFVMENARVLDRISFPCSRELQGLEMEKVKEKLVLVKRSSSTVIVEYEYPPEEFAF